MVTAADMSLDRGVAAGFRGNSSGGKPYLQCCFRASRRTSSLTAMPSAKLATSSTSQPPSCFTPAPPWIHPSEERMAQTAAAKASRRRKNLTQDRCKFSAMDALLLPSKHSLAAARTLRMLVPAHWPAGLGEQLRAATQLRKRRSVVQVICTSAAATASQGRRGEVGQPGSGP